MSTDKNAESEVARTVIEETAATGGGTAVGLVVGALVGGPVGAVVGAGAGAATTVFTKGIFANSGEWARTRADRRIRAFEHEIGEAVAKSTPDGPASTPDELAWIAASENFSEVVFQNYRRAIDALDPSVVPALARLTWLYKGRNPDAFFRSWGRLLEELSAEEYHALREIISAVVQFNLSCELTPWRSRERDEMRLQPIKGSKDPSKGEAQPVKGYVPGPGYKRVLALIAAQDLTYNPLHGIGTSILMGGSTKLELEMCKRALYVVGSTTVILFPATFDREPVGE